MLFNGAIFCWLVYSLGVWLLDWCEQEGEGLDYIGRLRCGLLLHSWPSCGIEMICVGRLGFVVTEFVVGKHDYGKRWFLWSLSWARYGMN